MNTTISVAFIVLAFVFGGVLVWKKDTIPSQLRRVMAWCALIFIVFAFFLIVYTLTTASV
ncbi:hypothetical protein [Paenibacillus marinisediminis]